MKLGRFNEQMVLSDNDKALIGQTYEISVTKNELELSHGWLGVVLA